MSRRAAASLIVYALALLGVYAFGYRASPIVREAVGPLPGWSDDWLWAFDHFRHHRYGLLGLAAIAVLAGAALAARRVGGANERAGRIAARLTGPLPLAATALGFWFLRVQYRAGDFLRLLEQLEAGDALHMSQPLTTAMFYIAHVLLPAWHPYAAIALVNCLAGPVYLWAAAALAQEFKTYRWLFWLVLVLQGSLILYFGYVEATAWALACGLLYVWAALRTLRGEAGLLLPSAILGVAIALHGSLAYLGASWLALAYYALRGRTPGARVREGALAAAALAAPALLMLGLALAFPAAVQGKLYGDALGGTDSSILVPLTGLVEGAQGTFTANTLFSAAHNAEVANLIFIVSPLLPWLLAATLATWGWPGGLAGAGEKLFFGALAAGALAFLWLWNPDWGMRYDFDLFASTATLVTLAAALRLFRLLEARAHGMGGVQSAAWAAGLGVCGLNLLALLLAYQPAFSLAPIVR